MYRRLDTDFWDHPKWEGEHRDLLLIAAFFLSHPSGHVSGLFRFRKSEIGDRFNLSANEVQDYLNILESKKFIFIDEAQNIVWVKNAYRQNAKSPDLAKGIARHLVKYKDSFLVKQFLEYYQEYNIPLIDGLHTILTPSQDGPQMVPTPSQDDPGTQSSSRTGTEQKKKNSSLPSSSSSGGKRDDKRKLPLLKKPKDIEAALAKLDFDKLREKYEPQGLDVKAWFANFKKYAIQGSAKDPYPNPSNWRDWPAAARDSAEGAIAKGRYLLKAKPENHEPINTGKGAAKKLLDALSIDDQAKEQDRNQAEILWKEINRLSAGEQLSLRNRAVLLAQKTAPGVRLPEVVVKMTMIKLFLESTPEVQDIFAETEARA